MIEGDQDSVACRLIVPKTQGRSIPAKEQGRAIADLSGLPKGESVIIPKPVGLSAFVQVLQIDSVRVKLF